VESRRAYQRLLDIVREAATLESCISLLAWDEETYLPPRGVEHRANQLALLMGMHHESAVQPRLGDLLAEVEASDLMRDADSPEAANVREIRRRYNRLIRVPKGLVEEITRTSSLAHEAWATAWNAADFAGFRPWLEKIVHLKRQQAEALGYTDSPYDALLDEYEPGATYRQLAEIFLSLRQDLLPLATTLTHAARHNPDPIAGAFPLERQRSFAIEVAATLGFDFSRGRLDASMHPFFAAIGPGDCRLTTRYVETNLGEAFFGVLHEVGHGLYEQSLDPTYFGQPIGETGSLGLHESQARLWENLVGRSRPFWEHFLPRARQLFPRALDKSPLDTFHFAVNQVHASCNRVRADEVTYNFHILVRFDLEKALVTGELDTADVPGAWNEAYRHYLGVVPANDREGCLQDSHWSAGQFGYFPTYALGNILAAQLFERADEEMGDLWPAFSRGDFSGLLAWLKERVYRHGRRFTTARLLTQVTGSPLDHRPLVRGLKRKYEELYRI
jgi:carboxypeptidase Taq